MLGLNRSTRRAPAMSSTRRTKRPARSIPIGASLTALSRRRQRSMIAVTKLRRSSFGIFSFTSPALVCSALPWLPARLCLRASLRS
jgi:hypothetical protein